MATRWTFKLIRLEGRLWEEIEEELWKGIDRRRGLFVKQPTKSGNVLGGGKRIRFIYNTYVV
jgi:hypothetical protein